MTSLITEKELIARRLPITGTFNVRDIGGYDTEDGRRTRWKTMLRGDALHLVDQQGRESFASLGLKTAVDLREPDEREHAPDQLHADVQLVSVPIFSYAAPTIPTTEVIDRSLIRTLPETYDLMVRTRGAVLVVAIRALLEPGALPAIVHCTAGKDRTGVIVALVLSAIGVPDELIARDYSATSLFLNEEYLQAMIARRSGVTAEVGEERLRHLLSCEPELILGTLATIRDLHGDVATYLLCHGLTQQELADLREALTEVGLDEIESETERT